MLNMILSPPPSLTRIISPTRIPWSRHDMVVQPSRSDLHIASHIL